jgi:hypothetical protein
VLSLSNSDRIHLYEMLVNSDRIYLYESSLCLSHFFVTLYKPIGLMDKGSKSKDY